MTGEVRLSQTTKPATHPLLDVLRSRNALLADQANRLVQEAHRFLEYTISTFSGGTDHTWRHTTTVEQIGRMVLTDEFLNLLSDEELFFLSVACHYHDLAMAGTEADDETPETREQVRIDHAVRIGSIITEKWLEIGFEDLRTAEILGEICRGHRPHKNSEGEANWDELNNIEVLRPNASVRVRLLSSITYAIDELHLGADRAPARIQNWRQIRNPESRRHWRRHQAINGPDRSKTGTILYQIKVNTPAFEENLRAQVLRKALAAVRDLRKQAQDESVNSPLPNVEVHWDRRSIWAMLLPLICSDLQPRGKDEIVQSLLDRFANENSPSTDLSDLCIEKGNLESELLAGANRCVADAITIRHLVPSERPTEFVLSVEEPIADIFFARMRESDELDRLFLGQYQACWEELLFESPYGRTYVTNCVLPSVDRTYSVALTKRPSSDGIRIILETCPTASRLVTEFAPSPSNLGKEPLLIHATICGALFDLFGKPERLLSGDLRTAIRSLTEGDDRISPCLRFLEELAIIGGLSGEQVLEAQTTSEAAKKALKDVVSSEPELKIEVTQTIPSQSPVSTTHLPRLLLASLRANAPITLKNSLDHNLAVEVTSEAKVPIPDSDSLTLGLSPVSSQHPKSGKLPARLEVDRSSRTIRFYLGRFNTGRPTPFPVVVTLPPPPTPGARITVRFAATIQWSEVMVGDLRSFDLTNQLIRTGNATIEFLSEDSGELIASAHPNDRNDLFHIGKWNSEILKGLRGLDRKLPIPHFIPLDEISELGSFSASERTKKWQQLRKNPPEGHRRITSLFLRITTAEQIPIDEKFLRYFPFNLFPAPVITGDENLGVEEFERRWESGDVEFLITAYFQADIYEMSESLNEWCKNPENEFPFKIDSSAIKSPTVRSALAIRFLPARDRGWHADRPIIFEFRPVNRGEAYKLEAGYWRSVKDEARAKLADELHFRFATSENASAEHESVLASPEQIESASRGNAS